MEHVNNLPEPEWGIIETDQFKITEGKDKRFFVVDNFYTDPTSNTKRKK